MAAFGLVGAFAVVAVLCAIVCTLSIPVAVYYLMLSSGSSRQTSMVAALVTLCVLCTLNTVSAILVPEPEKNKY